MYIVRYGLQKHHGGTLELLAKTEGDLELFAAPSTDGSVGSVPQIATDQ